jgi:hypothetical protein
MDTAAFYRFLWLQFFCLIYLQKLAVPIPGLPAVSLPLIVLLVSFASMTWTGRLRVSPLGLGLYGMLVAAVTLSHIFVLGTFSVPSLLLFVIMCSEFAFVWDVDADFYRKAIGIFPRLMVVPALMVFAQLACEFVLGSGHTLSIEVLVPAPLLLPGYIYEAPIRFGAHFVRPNGFFMLEPSFISALLAMAVLVEVMYLRRPRMLILFISALFGTVGATGILLLAVAAPFVLARQSARFIARALVVCGLTVGLAAALNGDPPLFGRLSELGSNKSSGTDRLVRPAERLVVVLNDPGQLVTGMGAGQLDESSGNAWPAVKLIQEYGMLVTVLYLVLFIVAIWRSPNLPLKIGIFVVFHLTGGYLLNPIMQETVVLLCTIMVQRRVQLPRLQPIKLQPW